MLGYGQMQVYNFKSIDSQRNHQIIIMILVSINHDKDNQCLHFM